MKKKLTLFCLALLISAGSLNAQCNCNPLPAPPVTQAITITPAQGVAGIQNAINSATGPKTIYLASGTYSVNTTYINVTKPNITIRSVTGNQNDVIIKGTGMQSLGTTYHGIAILNRKCTLADLTIRDIDCHPVAIDFWYQPGNIDSLLLHNLHIIDGGQQLVKMSYSGLSTQAGDNGIIECCTIEYSTSLPGNQSYTNGIDLHYAHNWIIRDNTIRNIKHGPSTTTDAGAAILFFKQGANPIIERNKIINCDEGISLGNWADNPNVSCYAGIVRNNIVRGHTNSRCGLLAVLCQSATIINNSVYSPGGNVGTQQAASIEVTGTLTTNCLLQNNLCDESIFLNTAPPPILVTNNFSATAAYFTSTLSTSATLLKLSPTAPAPSINAGTSHISRTIDVDCQGMSGNYDIGADELLATGIENYSANKNDIIVYPNPFNDELNIKFTLNDEATILIDDILGKTIVLIDNMTPNEEQTIKLKTYCYDLKPGIYFIKINCGNTNTTYKLLKNQ